MKVAVAGGTGLVGRAVVARLEESGHEAVVLSRATGIDLTDPSALPDLIERVRGVEAIVDATASPTTTDRDALIGFFVSVARHLRQAAEAAGVRRVVTLSIVGIDRMPGYAHYAAKLAQEEEARAGALPATILRATQFHDFGGQLTDWRARGPLLLCPVQPVQTVGVPTVAAHLVRLAQGAEEGATVDLAGPQRHGLARQVRRTARARGRRLAVVPVWVPGGTWAAARRGAALPGPDAVVDGPSFDDWVAAGA